MVHERLRRDILWTTLAPNSKLNIAALAEDLGVSAGAVREGLAILEAESFVVSEPLKGYRVSPVSAEDLTSLVQARIALERLCLAESIRCGDLEWEGMVVAASHRLSRVPEHDPAPPFLVNTEWAERHGELHRAIVAGCPNVWLLRARETMYIHSERYRQFSAQSGPDRDTAGEHKALIDAVLNRDVSLAQDLIASHLQATANLVLSSKLLSAMPTKG